MRLSYQRNHGSTLSGERMCYLLPMLGDELMIVYRLGGMCGAIVTSPLDVVKTRLQSSLFRQAHVAPARAAAAGVSGGTASMLATPKSVNLLYNFVETAHIIRFVMVSSMRNRV